MDFFRDRMLYLMAVALYGVATAHAVLVWRRGFQRGERLNQAWILLGFMLHTLALARRGFTLRHCPVTNLFEAVLFVSWVIAAAYAVGGLWNRLRPIGILVAPVLFALGCCGLQPALDTPGPGILTFDIERAGLSLHVTLILLAYACFGLGSLAAVLILACDPPPQSPSLQAWAHRLPPLPRLESVLIRTLAAGLVLLTAGLAVSFVLMRERYGVLVRPDPKIGWSLFVWALYVGLLASRLQLRRGLRGVAWGTLISFGFVMLTFWGTNLLSPIHRP